jgi:hypothetical protein
MLEVRNRHRVSLQRHKEYTLLCGQHLYVSLMDTTSLQQNLSTVYSFCVGQLGVTKFVDGDGHED